MNGRSMEWAKTAKYLGIILNHKLKWKTHILQKISKVKKQLFMYVETSGRKVLWSPAAVYEMVIHRDCTPLIELWGSGVVQSRFPNRNIESAHKADKTLHIDIRSDPPEYPIIRIRSDWLYPPNRPVSRGGGSQHLAPY
jgi:hypothetical protein